MDEYPFSLYGCALLLTAPTNIFSFLLLFTYSVALSTSTLVSYFIFIFTWILSLFVYTIQSSGNIQKGTNLVNIPFDHFIKFLFLYLLCPFFFSWQRLKFHFVTSPSYFCFWFLFFFYYVGPLSTQKHTMMLIILKWKGSIGKYLLLIT